MSSSSRVALVTGGERGLGAAAAKALRDAGFEVAASYLGGDKADAFHKATGIPVFEWDVSDFDACGAGIARVEEELGPIDVLVNNAGVNKDRMLHKMDRADWDAVIDVDLGSMFNMCRHIIPGMRKREYGRVINISSVNAANGQAGQTNYCAAKAGVEGFTRALARESVFKGITVNAISPGYVETAMVTAMPQKIIDNIVAQIPVGRLGQPDEIAHWVRLLASEDAGFVTGATFPINGGLRMG
ncbi:acetoacetyl-CoA reductase [Roseovarius sp. Pro17]|uniref:acetoacetyl-CoA reductase n=1 Tax=Roseovarius sp. Pro17 TaxID=3108175 RepID=UPI002D798C03|nr:acetoacetyl-CoA reductase [Roseovarius sp. Pro17]